MELLFHRVYEMAEMMAEIVMSDFDPFGELDWEFPDINDRLNKFSKTSLLWHFCYIHLSIYENRRFRKDPETVDVQSIQNAFRRHAIPFISFENFLLRNPPDEDEQEALYPWMLDQAVGFEQHVGRHVLAPGAERLAENAIINSRRPQIGRQ